MKLLVEDHVVEFLVSRGLYVLANSAVPVLLAIAVASEGYSASGVGLVLGVGALPGILGALLAPQMLVHVSPKTMFGGAAAAWVVICGGIAMLSRDGSVGLGVYVSVSFALDYLAGDGIAPLGYVAVPALAMWLGQGTSVLMTAGVCVLVLLGCLWACAVSTEVEQVEPSVE